MKALAISITAAALLPFAVLAQQPPASPDPSAQEQPAPSQRGATFESLDADSDGRISKTEAAANQAVLDQFSRYDKDGNGYIERAEVTSANQSPPAGAPPQQ